MYPKSYPQHPQQTRADLKRSSETELAPKSWTLIKAYSGALCKLGSVCDRTQLFQFQTATLPVVVIHIVIYLLHQFIYRQFTCVIETLRLQYRKEAFHRCIVPTIRLTRHALNHGMLDKQFPIRARTCTTSFGLYITVCMRLSFTEAVGTTTADALADNAAANTHIADLLFNFIDYPFSCLRRSFWIDTIACYLETKWIDPARFFTHRLIGIFIAYCCNHVFCRKFLG